MERELRYAEALRVYQQCALVSVGEKIVNRRFFQKKVLETPSTGLFSRKKRWKRRRQGFFSEKSAENAVDRAFFQKKVLS